MDEKKRLRLEERRSYLLGLLADEDPGNRWKAIEALAREGDSNTIDPLIQSLSDEDWRVRQKAAWALGHLGDPRALAPLRRALREEREGVKEMIIEAIDEITMKSGIETQIPAHP